jgi:hypothetical protein
MGAMIALGMSIFWMIAGSEEGSIMNTMKGVWEGEIILRTSSP